MIPLVFVIGFSPLLYGGSTHVPVTLVRLTLLVGLCGWFLTSIRGGRVSLRRTELDLPIVLFLALAVFTTVRSPYLTMSLQWLGSILSYAVFFFLLIQLVDEQWKIRLTLYVVIVIGCLEAVLGSAQWLVGESARVKGTFFNPNFLATYLVALSALILGMVTTSPAWRDRIVGATIFAIMVSAILLTGSRGGWLAFAVAIGCIVWLRFGKAATAMVLAAMLCATMIPGPLQQRLLSEHQHNPYTYARLDIWKSAIDRAIDYPLGTGLGIFKYTSQQYPTRIEGAVAQYATRAQTAHNEYLHIGVELGIAGLLVFCWGIARMGKALHHIFALDHRPEYKGVLIGVTGGMAGMLVHAAVDSTLHEPALALLLILFGALAIVIGRAAGRRETIVAKTIPSTRCVTYGVYAIVVLMSVVIVRPTLAWYAFLDGEQRLQSGDVDGSLGRFEWSELFDPGNARYYDAYALAAYRKFDQFGELRWAQEALSALNDAMDLNPLDARYASHRGRVYAGLARKASDENARRWALHHAEHAFQTAVERDPYSPGHHLDLAETLVILGDHQRAQKNVLRAVALEPNYLPARHLLARLYLLTGNSEQAAVEYREILNRRADFENRSITPIERNFLDVDVAQISRALASSRTPR